MNTLVFAAPTSIAATNTHVFTAQTPIAATTTHVFTTQTPIAATNTHVFGAQTPIIRRTEYGCPGGKDIHRRLEVSFARQLLPLISMAFVEARYSLVNDGNAWIELNVASLLTLATKW
ncbi:MAG TPA: hypothetical protein VK660_10555 [Xanthomonadaceae bacterium]|nr:hypothetical protein [Xanthomonadaceae bacterium]